jgi:hypothetical protein
MERWGRLMWRLGSGLWLGSIFFLFVAIAPNVFRVLPESDAGRLVDAIFPVYYAMGLALGGLLLLGSVLRMRVQTGVRSWIPTIVGIINLLLVWWADRILAAMQKMSAGSAVFHAMHQRSVAISAVVFVVMLFGVVYEAVAV